MHFLTVAACFHRIHHDVLGCHEGQLGAEVFLHNLRIYHQTVYHVEAQIQDAVDGKEALSDAQPLVGGVVQCPLKPLGGGGDGRIQGVDHDVAGQGCDPLAAHGVALVCHGGGTDLVFLKGLFHLF